MNFFRKTIGCNDDWLGTIQVFRAKGNKWIRLYCIQRGGETIFNRITIYSLSEERAEQLIQALKDAIAHGHGHGHGHSVASE